MKKVCKCCGLELDIGLFTKDKYSKDGLKSKCKKCSNILFAEWRNKNKDIANKSSLNYYYKNREKSINYSKEYKEKNNTKIKERYKLYYKDYYNREDVKIKIRLRNNRKRTIIKERDDGTINVNSVLLLLEKQDYKCNMCRSNIRNITMTRSGGQIVEGKHLDHIISISKGGQHSINNVQWLCWSCNLKKGDR